MSFVLASCMWIQVETTSAPMDTVMWSYDYVAGLHFVPASLPDGGPIEAFPLVHWYTYQEPWHMSVTIGERGQALASVTVISAEATFEDDVTVPMTLPEEVGPPVPIEPIDGYAAIFGPSIKRVGGVAYIDVPARGIAIRSVQVVADLTFADGHKRRLTLKFDGIRSPTRTDRHIGNP